MKGIDFIGGGGGGGLIVETNCILEYKPPPPHFRRDVVYKMGGRINGTLRYDIVQGSGSEVLMMQQIDIHACLGRICKA